jgi:hypothetical protein
MHPIQFAGELPDLPFYFQYANDGRRTSPASFALKLFCDDQMVKGQTGNDQDGLCQRGIPAKLSILH